MPVELENVRRRRAGGAPGGSAMGQIEGVRISLGRHLRLRRSGRFRARPALGSSVGVPVVGLYDTS